MWAFRPGPGIQSSGVRAIADKYLDRLDRNPAVFKPLRAPVERNFQQIPALVQTRAFKVQLQLQSLVRVERIPRLFKTDFRIQ